MDDVDGALFSRVPLSDSGTDLKTLVNQSEPSLIDSCRNEGKYSKVSKSTNVYYDEDRYRTGQKCSNDIIVKRESVPVFRSIPPKYRGADTNVDKSKILKVSLRVSAPCELNKENLAEPAGTSVTHQRTGSVKYDRPNSSKALLSPRLANSSDCVENERPNSPESTELDKRLDIPPEVLFYTSKNEGSCNSFGDIDSNWGDDPHVNKETPDLEKDSGTKLVTGPEKNLLKEVNNTPSRVSSVFYLNEEEPFNYTNSGDNKNKADETADNVFLEDTKKERKRNVSTNLISQQTDSVDSTDANCPDISEPVKLENQTEKLVHTEVSENETMLKNNKRHVVLSLIFPVLSLSIYIWDIGSDIRLAVAYKDQGDMNLFWITLACIVIPMILMSIVDVSWLWLDRPPSTPSHIIRYILGVITLGRVVRSIIYMWHIVKSETLVKVEERHWHKNRATEEKRDCYMLDFINAFAESVPQLFVQLYLMYAFDLELTVIRILNLLSSWASIAWTYSAYYRCNREILSGKQDLKVIGFIIFSMSVLSALAARGICVVLFFVYFKTWIGSIVLTAHFILTLLWIVFRDKPTLEGTTSWKLGKYMYCVFFAYVSLLCFLNLRNSRAKFRMIAFYLLIYTENFTFAALSFYKMYVSQTGNEKIYNLLALPVGFILHIALLVTYYKIFHPKTGICT